MTQPLVIAYHLIWTAYGWWLPNDPRGSWSRTVTSDVLADLGMLHFGRKQVQPAGWEIRTFYESARHRLKHELLAFSPRQFAAVAGALATTIEKHRYTCYACVVMPDHVHLLIRKHRHSGEEMIANFQSESRVWLGANEIRPSDHPVWTQGGWKVFLDHPEDIWRTVSYIQNNPKPLRLPVQRWPFVKRYDNWPLHAGHSVRSPYVKALAAAKRYPAWARAQARDA